LLGYSNRNNIILELNEKDKIGDYPFKEIKKKKKKKKERNGNYPLRLFMKIILNWFNYHWIMQMKIILFQN